MTSQAYVMTCSIFAILYEKLKSLEDCVSGPSKPILMTNTAGAGPIFLEINSQSS